MQGLLKPCNRQLQPHGLKREEGGKPPKKTRPQAACEQGTTADLEETGAGDKDSQGFVLNLQSSTPWFSTLNSFGNRLVPDVQEAAENSPKDVKMTFRCQDGLTHHVRFVERPLGVKFSSRSEGLVTFLKTDD